jgi:hypothetical protein
MRWAQCWTLPWFMYRDQSIVLPRCREVMGEEDRVENLDQAGYRSLWELLQGPFRDTVFGPAP